MPGFADKYAKQMIATLKSSGASQAEINGQTKEMTLFTVNYKNPFYNVMMANTEILPVGLVVTLTSTLILKTKQAKNES